MQISLTPDYSLLAIMVIFILNYLIVSRFFLGPINKVIEARENDVRSANEVYEQSMARFNEATSAMEEKLHLARHAAAHRASVVDKTTGEAKSIVSDADASLTRAAAEARETIKRESDALARLAAERILGRAV